MSLLTRRGGVEARVPVFKNQSKIVSKASQLLQPEFGLIEFFRGDRSDLAARAPALVSLLEDGGQLGQRKAERKSAANEPDALDGVVGIDAVVVRRTAGSRQNSDALIVSERVRTHATETRQHAGSDGHGGIIKAGTHSRVKRNLGRSPWGPPRSWETEQRHQDADGDSTLSKAKQPLTVGDLAKSPRPRGDSTAHEVSRPMGSDGLRPADQLGNPHRQGEGWNPEGVVTPEGFEPSIFALKGRRANRCTTGSLP
jgi:hypothetical protein